MQTIAAQSNAEVELFGMLNAAKQRACLCDLILPTAIFAIYQLPAVRRQHGSLCWQMTQSGLSAPSTSTFSFIFNATGQAPARSGRTIWVGSTGSLISSPRKQGASSKLSYTPSSRTTCPNAGSSESSNPRVVKFPDTVADFCCPRWCLSLLRVNVTSSRTSFFSRSHPLEARDDLPCPPRTSYSPRASSTPCTFSSLFLAILQTRSRGDRSRGDRSGGDRSTLRCHSSSQQNDSLRIFSTPTHLFEYSRHQTVTDLTWLESPEVDEFKQKLLECAKSAESRNIRCPSVFGVTTVFSWRRRRLWA